MSIELVNKGTGFIYTYTGKRVSPLDMKPEDIDPLDIAHALSNVCRYAGHVDYFYSVAQHSVLVADQFEEETELRKWALLHDASEAYLGDIVAPLKYCGHFEFYKEAEERLMNVIAERFDLNLIEPPEVKEVDLKIRANEMRDLKGLETEGGFDIEIKPWLPSFAKQAYIWELYRSGIDVGHYGL